MHPDVPATAAAAVPGPGSATGGARPRPRVVVVGGGVSGLVVAWRLRDAADVVVLEQAATVGGKLRVAAVGDVEIDVGAESFVARRPEAVDLIREVGLADRLVHPVTATANVLRGGHLHPLPAGTVMGVPSRVDALAGLLDPDEVARAAAEPDAPLPDVDDTDVASWVGDRLGAAVVDRLVEPLLGGVYAGHARLLSARATLPGLWAQAARTGTLLGAARTVVAAAPDQGPARPVFGGLRGGLGRLPEVLADRVRAAGGTVRTRVTVRALERTGTRWRLALGAVPAPEHVEADAVVLAVPAAPTSRLLAALAPDASRELALIETASVAVVGLLVRRDDLGGLRGSGVLVPPAEGRPVKAMTFSSAKWAWVDALDARYAVVRLSLGRHREEAVLQRDDRDLAALAVDDASRTLGRPLHPAAVTVVRWGGGLPQLAVGHLDRIARVRADVATLPGLALCGAALDGVGIPTCVAAADQAADRVLRHLRAAAATGVGERP